jgi:hypothetical protein
LFLLINYCIICYFKHFFNDIPPIVSFLKNCSKLEDLESEKGEKQANLRKKEFGEIFFGSFF